jgi:hypothetical protein
MKLKKRKKTEKRVEAALLWLKQWMSNSDITALDFI